MLKNKLKVNIINGIKIVTTLIIMIVMICFVDYLIYLKFKNQYIKKYKETGILEIFPPSSYLDNYKGNYSIQSLIFQSKNSNKLDFFREVQNKNYKNKKSILIFGCSFAYSYGLEDNETISNKLSLATERIAYNFGMSACGIQHMLYLIKNPNLYKKIEQEPEHIIYIYIPSHIMRLNQNISNYPLNTNGINLKYKLINNTLKLEKSPLNKFSKSFIIKSIYYQKDLKRDNNTEKNKKYNTELAKKIFIESKKELEKKYPNIKYTILRYEVEGDGNHIVESSEMWQELKNEGFNILKTSDLIGRKYKNNSKDTNEDFIHPSEYALDLLVPPLVKALNL